MVGPAEGGEVSASRLILLQGLTAAGVAITQLLGDGKGNREMDRVLVAYEALAAEATSGTSGDEP